ncbi:phosphoribosyl-ATP pyrophosphatase [Enterococcus haemoperoxidus ATCC BAA-382]|uniref:Phosphoribosyl-ATP pyrophosphatase n=1 Tax=Enterococcus haemoperoxidus ATCC BAA-382 TaxID=1158608 RepID=R2QCN4_9ENTE|nr:phosphoribosyl-ATP diphosphatase [Enterococcus haemoperoxidus]EOH92988.1 phosphoribosyl-ATP pyrophosphatase [Enterococcus haemoperoxidus ATCC BAA-382]EOT61442.1 phosphoribosyl-ATP pyrophosphatase [Enterococcus haemoperoxidus ATCC BAA-382]OJG55274.1 phosphoribosyl-ATP pyrophosphatase [Enterococcus haemoperoxidus]
MIETLYEEIQARKVDPKEGSYTNYLFEQGLDKILKKVGEEATEVIIAAKNDEAELISETSDLIYHMLVLLAEKDISLEAVKTELKKREGKLSKTKERKQIDEL